MLHLLRQVQESVLVLNETARNLARNLSGLLLLLDNLFLSNLFVVDEVIQKEEVDAGPDHRQNLDELKAFAVSHHVNLVAVGEDGPQKVVQLVVLHLLVLGRDLS